MSSIYVEPRELDPSLVDSHVADEGILQSEQDGSSKISWLTVARGAGSAVVCTVALVGPGQTAAAQTTEQFVGIPNQLMITPNAGQESLGLSQSSSRVILDSVLTKDRSEDNASHEKPRRIICQNPEYLKHTKIRLSPKEYSVVRQSFKRQKKELPNVERQYWVAGRQLPHAGQENCSDRAKLYQYINEDARLRLMHPTKILTILGKRAGWTEDEVWAVRAIIEGGRGNSRPENATWNPCRKQGRIGNGPLGGDISCATAIRLGDQNTSIGYGIGQATPGYKMQSYGADWATNPVTQSRWLIDYINTARGGPYPALSFKLRNGYY